MSKCTYTYNVCLLFVWVNANLHPSQTVFSHVEKFSCLPMKSENIKCIAQGQSTVHPVNTANDELEILLIY